MVDVLQNNTIGLEIISWEHGGRGHWTVNLYQSSNTFLNMVAYYYCLLGNNLK